MLAILTFPLGPLQTNGYLLVDEGSGEAVMVDPGWDGETVAAELRRRGLRLGGIWLTHAHFDHFAGAAALAAVCLPSGGVALHSADLPLWRARGGASYFGFHIDPGPEPSLFLAHGQALLVGGSTVEVRHTPGHTPGHVIFYLPAEGAALCGDVIFAGSIGRTDLPGGSFDTLLASIENQVLTLPGDTRLLPGHGPATSVAVEREHNPFLK